ncbi:TAXI family TRAP transporter solute-binding subunit [Pikeienuella piscinae]|uniref:TAXI family TRAP transporter solute-binding subunit n=1 Tax=Pikeienuella piscinae TaxID=2748098 RepID=A0A7L5BXZ6_9RHOB|nr:TAXI family TRAP transporter solute-binding subunit [Pikeienuella piscinae]QIE56795.1 TAXI family TRAP transporter solute-binding subunit [Pikeienuella piscinae]
MKLLYGMAALALSAAPLHADEFVRMVSGPAGGSWYPLGAKIMQVMEESVEGISTSNTSGGGVGNVKAVNAGDAEMGWSYGHTTANGYNGVGSFDKKQENVRHFATLYPSYFQTAVPADSDIQSYADMKDKNISPGQAGFTGTAFAESILEYYGFDFEDIKANGGTVSHASYTESVALMKDGHIDVYMAVTSMPQASFIELEQSPGIRFIGIPEDDLQKIMDANPGYIPGVMPAGVYESVKEETPTLGAVANIVISKDVPEEIVYEMCKAFWANHDTFAEVKGIWNRVKLESALDGVAIPVHPGAQRCYDELGVSG